MTRHHLITDDGREVSFDEVADCLFVTADPHDPETCDEGCWVCAWERYMETERWAG